MKYLEKIYKAINNNSFGIYVGAGLSVGAGLPNWKTLLEDLIKMIEAETSTPKDRVNELRKLINDPTKYLLLAEEIRESLSDDLNIYIKEKFDDRGIKPTKAHELAVSLKSKFVVTTNYDTLLEKAFIKTHLEEFPNVLTYEDASAINYNLWNDEYFILKAHGDAKNAPKNIVLTEKDYRKIIHQTYGYQSVLHTIFSSCTILFLGASLTDPELLLLLGFIHNIFHGGSPHHFALMDKDKITKTEIDRWRKDYNIHIIEYDSKDNHVQVNQVLEEIVNKTGKLVFK